MIWATLTADSLAAGTAAVSSVVEMKVVASASPFQRTIAPLAMPMPFTVRVNASPPRSALFGVRPVRAGSTRGVRVAVGVRVTVGVRVAVAVGVGVTVGVRVAVAVGGRVGVRVDVGVGVAVGVHVAVAVGVRVGVRVAVGVGDCQRYGRL